MKTVTMTFHNTTVAEGDRLSIAVGDNDEVKVLEARGIGGTDTRFQFVIVSESISEEQRRARRARV